MCINIDVKSTIQILSKEFKHTSNSEESWNLQISYEFITYYQRT